MSNIWADTFSTIREPHFSEEKKEKEEPGEKKHKEGPAEEKAEDKKGEKETEDDKPKKWWDDDGDGKGYEKGEVEGKFKKKVKKEEVELDEASVTDDRVRRNQKAFGSNYTPPRDWDQSANRGKGAVLNAKQKEKQRRKGLVRSAEEN